MSGGGGSTTSTTGLPAWAQPYVEDSLGSAVDLYKTGAYENVADFTPEQITAMEKKKELGGTGGVYDQIAADSYGATQAYRDAASGTGMFGADALGKQTAAMKDSIGTAVGDVLGQQRGQFQRTGNLGGARAQQSMDSSAMKVGGEMAAAELANRRSAALSGLVVYWVQVVVFKVNLEQVLTCLAVLVQQFNNNVRTKVMQPIKVFNDCLVFMDLLLLGVQTPNQVEVSNETYNSKVSRGWCGSTCS